MRRLFGILLTALIMVGWAQLGARADQGDWTISRYEMVMVAQPDGQIAVTIDFDFDFGREAGHGPFLRLPTRLEVPNDPDRWRVVTIDQITAASPSGAPAQVHLSEGSSVVEVRIGDENREVSGVQSYRVSFAVDGVVNPDVADQDEISWNAVDGFEVPIRNIEVTMEGPAEIRAAECVAGQRGGVDACSSQAITDNRVTWSQASLPAGNGMTVTTAFPAGTFVGAEPTFTKRLNLGNTLAVTPATTGVAGAVALVGVGGVALVARRRGRDQQWSGLTPGLSPADGEGAPVVYRDRKAPVAVRFTPPEDARPAEVGTLVQEYAQMKEISATLVDLAVRGYIQIRDTKNGKDKVLVKLRSADDLELYERQLVNGIFSSKKEQQLSKVTTMAQIQSKVRQSLNRSVTKRGWFGDNPGNVRARWFGLGGALVAVGGLIGAALGLLSGWGLVGVGVAVVGLAVIAVASFMPARTAAGSAMLAQAKGFELYLTTAEADQLRFDEGEDVFSRYLPYAIVFGVAERWTKLCAELAAQGQMRVDTSWYVGPYLLLANPAAFANDLAGLSNSMTSAMTSAVTSAAASGGSGFGGGVGGGVGGVGGGGW